MVRRFFRLDRVPISVATVPPGPLPRYRAENDHKYEEVRARIDKLYEDIRLLDSLEHQPRGHRQ